MAGVIWTRLEEKKKKPLSFHCQGFISCLRTVHPLGFDCSGSSWKTFASFGEKKAKNLLPSNSVPPNLFYLLPREESMDLLFHCVTKHAFLSAAENELSTISPARFSIQNKGAHSKSGLGTRPPGPHCLLVPATGTSAWPDISRRKAACLLPMSLTHLLPCSCTMQGTPCELRQAQHGQMLCAS